MADESNHGHLFGPGLPDAGKPVRVYFRTEHLYVDGHGEVHASNISIQAGGFSAESLTIEWSMDDTAYALIVEDVSVAKRLLADAPESLRKHTQHYHKSVDRRRLIWQTIGAMAACLVVAVGLLWWNYNEAVAWIARQVPPETELRIGRSGLEQFSSNHEMMTDSPYQTAVETIGEQLTVDTVYDYQWHVADENEINAFAMPGGVVVVYRGLIDHTETPEELAGVLAHEIQHIEQQHVLQGMIHALGWATVLAVVMGDASALAAILVFEVGSTYFSRELESVADKEGVRDLHDAGIDPSGLVVFFESLIAEKGDSSLTFLSTHPSSQNRIEAIEAVISDLPPKNYRDLPVDWASVVALREVTEVE